MKRNRALLLCGLLFVCAAQVQCTLGPGLSTPEQRERVINLTRALEHDPLAEDAPASRQWLQAWVNEVPEIQVYICDGLLRSGIGDSYPYVEEVNSQMMFSAAAFAIEHPDQARNRVAQFEAGVQGALKAYESLAQSQADAHSPFLDDLLVKRDRGELADYVAKEAVEKCKRANTALNFYLAGAGVGLLLGLGVAWWFGGRRAHSLTSSPDHPGESSSARNARTSQWVVFACAAYFVIVITALHLLHPEFDPRFWFMSGYALATHGWLMTTNFFVLGLATLVVAIVLREGNLSSKAGRLGFGLLTIGGLFIWLAGVFRDSLPHLLVSVVVFPSVVIAALLLSWSFRQAAGWRSIYKPSALIALGMLAAFLSLAADIGMPGLQQRAFIFLFLSWLAIVVHQFVQVTKG
jgi:hypothetical membrane protein